MSTNVNYTRIADEPHLYRDMHSKGVVNNDLNALNKYKEARAKLNNIRLLSAEQEKIKKEQNTLKQDVEEIKTLLYKLLENTNKWLFPYRR